MADKMRTEFIVVIVITQHRSTELGRGNSSTIYLSAAAAAITALPVCHWRHVVEVLQTALEVVVQLHQILPRLITCTCNHTSTHSIYIIKLRVIPRAWFTKYITIFRKIISSAYCTVRSTYDSDLKHAKNFSEEYRKPIYERHLRRSYNFASDSCPRKSCVLRKMFCN